MGSVRFSPTFGLSRSGRHMTSAALKFNQNELDLMKCHVQKYRRSRRVCIGLHLFKVMRGWIKLHSEVLHKFYASLSDARMIKSRRMRWAGYVVRMGEMRNA
jgi:hypothetical protein